MKKRLIVILAAAAILLSCCCIALLYMKDHSLSFSTGRFLIIDENTCMLIIDNRSPVVLSNIKQNEDLFSNLDSGDKILVLHDGIRESYPAQTGAYAVWKLGNGTLEDISPDVLKQLQDLGWISVEKDPVPSTEPDPKPQDSTLPEQDVTYHSVYANWSDSDLIYTLSLNRDTMTISSARHLPVYRLDTLSDVEQFYASFRNLYEMDGYLEITGAYEETFFDSNSLIVVYVSSGSGSYRFGVSEIKADSETYCVVIEQLNFPECVTDDMAGWFIITEATDSQLDTRNIDAYMSNRINR